MAGNLIPAPYTYPSSPHVRRHGPSGWKDYQRYREWLRDEFSFRCVYCLDREVWRDMREKMHIDHFEPHALRPDVGSDYTNLLYLCPACNMAKGTALLPNPCEISLGECLRINNDGSIEAINENGNLLIECLALDGEPARRRRRLMIRTLASLAQSDWPVFVDWMRYPTDLPDLRAKRNTPPSNSKPEGLEHSHHERRRRGELPEVY